MLYGRRGSGIWSERTEKGVNVVIKDEKGEQIRLDVEKVEVYSVIHGDCHVSRCNM